MKIAVATTNGGLDDNVSPVFGRCATYTIVEAEGKEIKKAEVVQNQFAAAMGGAGIQAAQFVANQGAEAVIAGNFGPNASAVLAQSNVKLVQAQGNVRDIVMKYINGELQPVAGPTVPMFGGRGMGRGGGFGMGRGMGRGRGMWQMPPTEPQVPIQAPQNKEQELASLEEQMKAMEQQLEQIKERIKELKDM